MSEPDFTNDDSDVRASTAVTTTYGAQPATLVDVARIAGVSPITVSRALSSPEQVRPPTLAKVHAAIRQTGYVKNMQAGGLASNKSRLVAIIVPTIAHSIFSEMIQAATDQLAAAGYQVLLALAGYTPEREEILVETILSRRPDGIILTGASHTDTTRQRLKAAAIPIVETWDMAPSPIDMLVGFSHEEVGNAMALHLLDRGYQRIGLLTMDDPRAMRRNQGIIATLNQYGKNMIATEIMPAPATFHLGREGAARILSAHPELDALACSSDTVAHGALTEAHSRQLRIPGDIAIIGFGDLSFSASTLPPLSSIRVDGTSVGTIAAEAILNRLQPARPMRDNNQKTRTNQPEISVMPSPVQQIIDTGFTLIVRGST